MKRKYFVDVSLLSSSFFNLHCRKASQSASLRQCFLCAELIYYNSIEVDLVAVFVYLDSHDMAVRNVIQNNFVQYYAFVFLLLELSVTPVRISRSMTVGACRSLVTSR